jgi:hypothetical protein
MAGVFSGLADFLFGIDKIDADRERQQEDFLISQSHDFALREQADYNRQLQYGRQLENQIAGRGNPSVAQMQLQAGTDQINRDAMARSAGGTGSNAALANYGALLQQADASSRLNQQQAVLRAQETQSAQNMLGGLYANMGQRSMAGYGNALGAGVQYGNMAMGAQQANQRAQAASVGTLLSTAGAIGGAMVRPPGADAMASGALQAAAPNPNAQYAAAMPGYAASNTNYGIAPQLTPADQPRDPYQASGYGNGLYPYSPSNSVGQR